MDGMLWSASIEQDVLRPKDFAEFCGVRNRVDPIRNHLAIGYSDGRMRRAGAMPFVCIDARGGFVRRGSAIGNGKSHSVFLLAHNRIFSRCFKHFFNVPLK
jgi:ribosomal protein L27